MNFATKYQVCLDELLEAACLVEVPSLTLVAANQAAVQLFGEEA